MSMKMMMLKMMMMIKMMEMLMMMTTTMMTMNDDDDDDFGGGGGGGNGDDVLHDKTVKDNASSRFLLVHTCVVSFFSPVVIKVCACLFLDLFHTIYRNTLFHFGSFIITKLSIWIYSCP